MMESKKISFGFSKITKKPNLLPVKTSKPENQVELIKCLEGQEIKLVEERKESTPIVIPMKENGKTSSALASLMKRRAVLLGEDDEPSFQPAAQKSNGSSEVVITDESINDDLDKRAAREILEDLKKNNEAVKDQGLVLPIVKPDELPLDGAKESNMDDYEAIPIEQYGLAMLRGMGWVEPPSKEKKPEEAPMVRPKGMGLGADKALKAKPLLVQPEKNEILEIKKQAYVRILGGKHKDAYGQIEGFDDDAGRVIVKLAIGGTKEAFNEFLCQPVSKNEFSQYGKCINTAKYEEYKKLENEHGQIIMKKEETAKQKFKPQTKREEKRLINSESNVKQKLIALSSRHKLDNDNASSSSNHGRARYRSRSTSRSRKYNSHRRYDKDDYISSGNKIRPSSSDSDTDSAYEHKHHKKSKSKSKSHSRKSKVSIEKSKHSRCNSNERSTRKTYKDSSSSDDTNDERLNQRIHHSNKKNKKKTKKSKKHRSRTPSRHRR